MESKQPINPLEIINPGNGLPGTVSPNQHVVVCPEEGGGSGGGGSCTAFNGSLYKPYGQCFING